MKKSVILDIFNGNRGHIETMKMPKDNSEKGDKLCNTYDELKEKLSPETYKLHEKFVDELSRDYNNEVDFYFAEGFKLGLLIGIECMEDNP
jgi:hypothetical protein